MDDNEKLKALVLARAGEAWEGDRLHHGVFLLFKQNPLGWWSLSTHWRAQAVTQYKFGPDLPASDPVWALVAPILGVVPSINQLNISTIIYEDGVNFPDFGPASATIDPPLA